MSTEPRAIHIVEIMWITSEHAIEPLAARTKVVIAALRFLPRMKSKPMNGSMGKLVSNPSHAADDAPDGLLQPINCHEVVH